MFYIFKVKQGDENEKGGKDSTPRGDAKDSGCLMIRANIWVLFWMLTIYMRLK